MTNREKLLQTAEYDRLCGLNANLRTSKAFAPCIMTALGEKVRMAQCLEHKADCGKCIADWLNEEVKA
jgi:hypothetical protein